MSLFAEYSLWYIPLCIIAGVGVALALYYRNVQTKIFPTHIIRIAFVLRSVFVTLLAMLLLAPYMQRTKRDIIQPTVVVIQDNSQSLKMHKDSLYYTSTYAGNLQALTEKLKKSYHSELYTFGEKLQTDTTLNFDEKRTNLSQALNDVYARYYNSNLGAIILASDGLFNNGDNPLYAQAAQSTIPIYTVALGNPNQVRDNVISDVQHNTIAFKNNPFTVRIHIESHNLKGKQSTITVLEGTKRVFETRVQANSDSYFTAIDCKLQTATIGRVVYTVRIQNHEDEITYRNNEYIVSIEVLESQQKILLVYEAVHPDVGALRRAIESNKNFALDVASSQEFKGSIGDYNCVIFHGMPQSYGVSKDLVLKAKQLAIPALYIYNSTMNLQLLDMVDAGVRIQGRSNNADEVQARYEKQNAIFEIDQDIQECLELAPPLFVPYGEYSSPIQSNVVLWQRMQQLQLPRPLLVFNNKDGYKSALFTGEGLWRWRMHAYRMNTSFAAFDIFINKCINYLALTEKRELFSVQSKSIIPENQDIILRAELYNKSYEPITNKSIQLRVFNDKGKEFTYSFTANDNFYTLNIGTLPVGAYTYKASTTIDGATIERTGGFMVMPLYMEYTQTRANHALLRALSQQTGGAMIAKEQMLQLYDSIAANNNVTPISYTSTTRTLWIDSIWFIIILIALVSTEWFLRKFYGGY